MRRKERNAEGSFAVHAWPSPVSSERVDAEIPEGTNLAAMLGDVHAHAYVNGDLIPRDWWARCYPRAGTIVQLRAIPAGGGNGDRDKQALRIVATLTLAIVAPYAAGAAGFSAGTWQYAAATAFINVAGQTAINALIPPPEQDRPEFGGEIGQLPTITSTRNRARPFGHIPRPYGRFRIFPDAAAQPFTEVQADDQFLRQVFSYGRGPLKFENLNVGDTDIGDFEDQEFEFRRGYTSAQLTDRGVWSPSTGVVPGGTPAFGDFWTADDAGTVDGVEYVAGDTIVYSGIDDVASSHAGGWDKNGNAPLTLFTNDVTQTDVSATMNSRNDQVVRGVSLTDDGQVSLDLVAPQGLGGVGQLSGDAQPIRVAYLLETSPGGEGNWSKVTAAEIEISGSGETRDSRTVCNSHDGDGFLPSCTSSTNYEMSFEFLGASFTTKRMSATIDLPAGDWDLRLTRVVTWGSSLGLQLDVTSGDYKADVVSGTTWTAMRTIGGGDGPISLDLDGLALLAVRLRATDQLGGVLDRVNSVTHSILPEWDDAEGEWVPQPTSNPAWIYRDIFTGTANGRPLPASRMDDAALIEWAAFADAAGLEWNAPIDPTTVFQAARDVAATGRAAFGMTDGKYSVVRDRIQATPTNIFTPRNSWEFSASRTFQHLPHALKVKFLNPDAGWQEDERIVLADGYAYDFGDGNGPVDAFGDPAPELPIATRFEVLETAGVTDAEQAWKEGRYHRAVAELRPESYEFRTSLEYAACRRGDRIRIQHDSISVGQGSGRLLEVYRDAAGDVSGVMLDQPVAMVEGTDYALRLRDEAGNQFYGQVTTAGGDHQALQFTAPINAPLLKRDALWAFGELGKETLDALVKEIRPFGDMEARIVAVPYAPEVHDADTGTIPTFDPQITLPADPADAPPPAPSIDSLRSDELVAGQASDGSLSYRLAVAFSVPSGKPAAEYVQVQARRDFETGWRTQSAEAAIGEVRFDEVQPGDTYDVRARSVSQTGVRSDWVTAGPHQIQGVTTAPPAVSGLQALGKVGSVHLSWDAFTTRIGFVEVLASTDSDIENAAVVATSTTTGADHNTGGGPGNYYWARAVDPSGTLRGPVAGPVFGKASASPDYIRDTLAAQDWAADTDYLAGQIVVPTAEVTLGGTVVHFQALDGGTSDAAEPDWDSLSAVGDTIVDNNITWEAVPRGSVPFQVALVDGKPTVIMPGAVIEDLTVGTLKLENRAAHAVASVYDDFEEQFDELTNTEYLSTTVDLGPDVSKTRVVVSVSLSNYFFWDVAATETEFRQWFYRLHVNGDSDLSSMNHEIPASPAVQETTSGSGQYVRRDYHNLRFLVEPSELQPGNNTFSFRGQSLLNYGDFFQAQFEGILMVVEAFKKAT